MVVLTVLKHGMGTFSISLTEFDFLVILAAHYKTGKRMDSSS